MGEIETKTCVRSIRKPQRLTLTWDSGSPWTFFSESAARTLGTSWELGEPKTFRGLGDGQFTARQAMRASFQLKGVWCDYLVWVVPDSAMPNIQILVGHEFMETYHIRLDPKRKRLVCNKKDLLRASFVYY